MVMANALRAAGKGADAEATRQGHAKTDWMSQAGLIKFDAHGDAHVPAHILHFQDGKYHVVK